MIDFFKIRFEDLTIEFDDDQVEYDEGYLDNYVEISVCNIKISI